MMSSGEVLAGELSHKSAAIGHGEAQLSSLSATQLKLIRRSADWLA
jgi:hypothetical protein